MKIPLDRLVGVSAVDHRLGPTLPDSSYHILNLDKLEESGLEKDSHNLILSFATFYHLVDPVGALVQVHYYHFHRDYLKKLKVYRLLAFGGVAIISHVPLAACIQGADSKSHLHWNRFEVI